MRGIAPGLVIMVLVGCSGDQVTDDDDATDEPTVAEVDFSTLLGGIQVAETTDDSGWTDGPRASVWGLYDRPFVEGIFPEWSGGWTGSIFGITAEQGDCIAVENLWSADCEPDCGSHEYCSPTLGCEPAPVFSHGGDLVFGGLTTELTLSPTADGDYVLDQAIPDDLFTEGTVVSVDAAGAGTPSFAAAVTAPPPLEPALPCDPIAAGQDYSISWTPGESENARVRAEIFFGYHAAAGPMIRCEVEDDGAFEVPLSMLDDPTSIPVYTVKLSRFDRAVVETGTAASVSFEVASSRACVFTDDGDDDDDGDETIASE